MQSHEKLHNSLIFIPFVEFLQPATWAGKWFMIRWKFIPKNLQPSVIDKNRLLPLPMLHDFSFDLKNSRVFPWRDALVDPLRLLVTPQDRHLQALHSHLVSRGIDITKHCTVTWCRGGSTSPSTTQLLGVEGDRHYQEVRNYMGSRGLIDISRHYTGSRGWSTSLTWPFRNVATLVTISPYDSWHLGSPFAQHTTTCL